MRIARIANIGNTVTDPQKRFLFYHCFAYCLSRILLKGSFVIQYISVGTGFFSDAFDLDSKAVARESDPE